MRVGGIGPGVAQGTEPALFSPNLLEDVQKVSRGASETIEPRDQEHVVGGEGGNRLAELGPVTASTAALSRKTFSAPGLELGDLGIEGLTFGRDAGIAIKGHQNGSRCAHIICSA
jgi:hypothetical protein